MFYLRLSIRSLHRSIMRITGLGRAEFFIAIGLVVALCLVATGIATAGVLQLNVASESVILDQLRTELSHGVVVIAVLAGLFFGGTVAPNEALRLLLRQTGGAPWKQYLLTAAARDVLAPTFALVLGAVTWLPLMLTASGLKSRAVVLVSSVIMIYAVTTATLSALDIGRALCVALRIVRSDSGGLLLTGVMVASLTVLLSPLSIFPWTPSPTRRWTLLTGGYTPFEIFLVPALVAAGALLLVGTNLRLAKWRAGVRPVLASEGQMRPVPFLGGRRLRLSCGLTLVVLSRIPLILAVVAMAIICAGAAAVSDSAILQAVLLTLSAGAAGAIGLRRYGSEYPTRWMLLGVATSRPSVFGGGIVGGLVVSALAAAPAVAVAALRFEPRASVYFGIVTLTSYGFSCLAGTLVPVSVDEPFSSVAASAVCFALSGGLVGIVRFVVSRWNEPAAASVALLGALAAICCAYVVADQRARRSLLA